MVYVNSRALDQPAKPHNLIRVFAVHKKDSTVAYDSVYGQRRS